MTEQQTNLWFKLFASCVVVKGEANSLIYDVERHSFYDLPNDLLELLELAKVYNLSDLLDKFEDNQVIKSFFNQFVGEEIGFYTTEPQSFPDIDFTWESPCEITNAIIEICRESDFNIKDIVGQLSVLGCRAIQLRYLSSFTNVEINEVLESFKCSRINHIELLIPFHPTLNINDLDKFMELEPRLNRIMVYGSPVDKIELREYKNDVDKAIISLKKDISIDTNEIIKKERFATSIEVFSESQRHNLGLNRKVCIGKNGEIKNYLSHPISFGNIITHKIKNVINDDEFRKKWFLNNDMIEVCKDCQYRYACVDNSDIIKIADEFHKVDKCGFDPFLDVWRLN